MSLDKAIEHGKKHRKEYLGSEAFGPTCRNHGSCKHCRDNRLHTREKQNQAQEVKLAEVFEEEI